MRTNNRSISPMRVLAIAIALGVAVYLVQGLTSWIHHVAALMQAQP